jgi:hypothetical protein
MRFRLAYQRLLGMTALISETAPTSAGSVGN